MSNLRQTIETHAQQFAAAIVQALRGASLDELVTITGAAGRGASPRLTGAAPKKSGRLGRRSADDIARVLENVVAVLAQHPEGLRAEQIKAALQLDTREMPRPLAEGLKSGTLKKSGQRRATVYTVGSGSVKARATKKRAATKKKAKKG